MPVNSGAFADILPVAEALYSRQGLPAIFRLSPLASPDIDEALQQANYRLVEPSQVMTARLGPIGGDGRVTVEDRASPVWLEGVGSTNGLTAKAAQSHARLVGQIMTATGFATLHDRGEAVGFGMAVVDRGMVGVFDILVAPEHRGKGFGRAIVEALLRWGTHNGASRAYLQVHQNNDVATNLYRSLGFSIAYAYHYRVQAIPSPE